MEVAKIYLPDRPKRSHQIKSIGEQINLITNMFNIQMKGKSRINIYHLQIQPEISEDARGLSDKIFRSAQQKISELLGQVNKSYTKGELSNRGWNVFAYKRQDGLLTFDTKFQEKEYTIRLTWRKEVDLCDSETMEGTGNQITMVLNNKVKKAMMDLGFIEIGRNAKFYNTKDIDKHPVQNQDLNVWQGFKTSIYLCPRGPYMLVDFSSRVLRQESVLDFFMSDNFKGDEDAKKALIGQSCMAYYGNHRIYKIDDVDLKKTPKSKFLYKDGKEITYNQYFYEQYNIKIQDQNQPLLLNNDKKTGRQFYLIPELMKMTGLTDRQRANGRLMQAVAQHTKLNAEQRFQYIRQNTEKISKQIQKENIDVKTDKPYANGHVLNAPKIYLGGKQSIQPQGGNFDLKQNAVYRPGVLKDWLLIYNSKGNRDDQDADHFVDDMKVACQAFGIKVENPEFLVVKGFEPKKWAQVLDTDFKQNGKPEFVLSLITSKDRNSVYPALKEFLYKRVGVPHQNVVKESLFKNRISVISKILLQISAKLNNPLWKVERPIQIDEKSRTMLVGIDMYHKLVAGKQSCAGFVSSVDPEFTEYYSRVMIQKPGEEILVNLTELIHAAVQEYFTVNKKVPEQIIIFRDGVGESQISSIIEMETQAILAGFKKLSEDYKPKLAYILINKQINHRFFVEESQKRGQGRGGKGFQPTLSNPPSGTVCAEQITTSKFDFMLASQNVRSGTCTPTHYIVGYNTTDLSEDAFWQLTYYQCFNYYNWSGAVKVPAPVQYAKKLSYLVGETFQSNPHKSLSDSLYYL